MKLSEYDCKLVKRVLLISLLLPFVAGLPYHDIDWSKSIYYIIPTTGLATYTLLLNFPNIVRFVHSRPLYYGDLEDDKYVNPSDRHRFQSIFIVILQITLTLIISGLIYYYYSYMHISNLSTIEKIGVLGGFISLLLKIENVVGKFALSCLNLWKIHNASTSESNNEERGLERDRTNSLAVTAAL